MYPTTDRFKGGYYTLQSADGKFMWTDGRNYGWAENPTDPHYNLETAIRMRDHYLTRGTECVILKVKLVMEDVENDQF